MGSSPVRVVLPAGTARLALSVPSPMRNENETSTEDSSGVGMFLFPRVWVRALPPYRKLRDRMGHPFFVPLRMQKQVLPFHARMTAHSTSPVRQKSKRAANCIWRGSCAERMIPNSGLRWTPSVLYSVMGL